MAPALSLAVPSGSRSEPKPLIKASRVSKGSAYGLPGPWRASSTLRLAARARHAAADPSGGCHSRSDAAAYGEGKAFRGCSRAGRGARSDENQGYATTQLELGFRRMCNSLAVAVDADAKMPSLTTQEWVVPPRPKPGRKSTKAESSAPARTATAASRSTQKASRERRQDQVAVLEERVRQLEADEGEKCVFYQQQAQKAKLEAATFQQENVQLRREVEQLRAELASARTYRAPESEQAARNRTHRLDDGDAAPVPAKRQRRTGPATSRARSRSSSNASPPVAQTTTSPVAHVTHSPLSDPQPGAPSSPGEPISLQVPRCTFCSSGPDCFCAQVGFDIAQTPKPSPDEHSHSRTGRAKATVEEHADDPFATATIFEPAVPLRLRRVGAATKAPPVWTLEPAVTGAARLIDAAKAVCSGDPSNCPACSDDPCVSSESRAWREFTHVLPFLQIWQGVLQRALHVGLFVTALRLVPIEAGLPRRRPTARRATTAAGRRRHRPTRVAHRPPLLRRPDPVRLTGVQDRGPHRAEPAAAPTSARPESPRTRARRDGPLQRSLDRPEAPPQHRLRRPADARRSRRQEDVLQGRGDREPGFAGRRRLRDVPSPGAAWADASVAG